MLNGRNLLGKLPGCQAEFNPRASCEGICNLLYRLLYSAMKNVDKVIGWYANIE